MSINGSVDGFIIDSPKTLIKKSYGNEYFTQVIHSQTGEVTFSEEVLNIKGGWSLYDIFSITSGKSIDITVTDNQWSMDYLSLASGSEIETGSQQFDMFGDGYDIHATTFDITIPYVVVASSVKINGYTESVGAPSSGTEFQVTINASNTTVLFHSSKASLTVYPSYKITVADSTYIESTVNDFPKNAEVILNFPIYADAEADTGDVVGYGELTIYKAKIAADYSFSGTYKSAYAPSIKFKALDPRRSDNLMWKFVYRPITVDTTAPTVTTVPADGATGIAVTADFVWTFSEQIRDTDINLSNFMVIKATDGSVVAGALTSSVGNTVVTFNPTASLTALTAHIGIASSNIKDLAGNHLAANNITNYTTS